MCVGSRERASFGVSNCARKSFSTRLQRRASGVTIKGRDAMECVPLPSPLQHYLDQNQLKMLQMVQFECPRITHPLVSFTFEEFSFLIFSSCCFPPSSLWGIKNWFIMGGCRARGKAEKVESFWNKISLSGCKWSSLNAPGTESPVSHSGWENFIFSFSAFLPLG